MTALEFLKGVSPSNTIGIRADLKAANLEKQVIDIMERYAQFQYNQAIRDAAEKALITGELPKGTIINGDDVVIPLGEIVNLKVSISKQSILKLLK